MKATTLPGVSVEAQFLAELEAVLDETETIESFVEQAVRGAVNYRRTQAESLAHGEDAWQEYLRIRQSSSSGEVFDRILGRIESRRQQLPPKS